MAEKARCAKTGKVQYPAWLVATQANIRLAQEGIHIYQVYQCRHCRQWHLATRGTHLGTHHRRQFQSNNAHRSKKNRR